MTSDLKIITMRDIQAEKAVNGARINRLRFKTGNNIRWSKFPYDHLDHVAGRNSALIMA